MKSTFVLPICVLVTGCGMAADPSAATDPTIAHSKSSAVRPARIDTPLVVPNYGIDAGAGTNLYPDNFAITTNSTGDGWAVYWTGDDYAHDFYGEISVPGTGGTVTLASFTGGYGDWATNSAPDLIQFEATTDGSTVPVLEFDSAPAAGSVRFNLFVDSIEAVYQIIFTYAGTESTTDAMPVDLTPVGAVMLKGQGTTQAKLKMLTPPAFRPSGTTATRAVLPPSKASSKAAER